MKAKLLLLPVLFASFSLVNAEMTADVETRAPKAASSSPVRSLTKKSKSAAFDTARIAIFSTDGGSPSLNTFDPISTTIIAVDYKKDVTKFDMAKRSIINYGANNVSEEVFDASKKKFLEKVTRGTAPKPETDELVNVYLKEFPLCLQLANNEELSALIGHLKASFENAGILPGMAKPMLIVRVNGKSADFECSLEESEFLHQYFNVTSFSDEAVRDYFLGMQEKLVDKKGDVFANGDYKTDGFFGGIVRKLNKNWGKGEPGKIGPMLYDEFGKKATLVAVAALASGVVYKKAHPYLPGLPNFLKDEHKYSLQEIAALHDIKADHADFVWKDVAKFNPTPQELKAYLKIKDSNPDFKWEDFAKFKPQELFPESTP